MNWPPPPAYSLVQATEKLPARAQRKLADLEAAASDAEVLARVLQDRIRKQETKCAEIARRRDRALATRDAEAVTELDRDLAGAIASLDKHRRDLNARNAVAANALQTLGRMRNFVQALCSGLGDMQPPPQAARLPPPQRPDETVLDALERLRCEIGAAQSELARVRSAPLPVKEIKAQIAAQVDAMARAGAPRVAMKTATEVAVSWPDLPPVPIPDAVYSPGAASRFACWLHGDKIKAELCADLPADSPHVIPSADRPGKLRALEQQIYGLEISEEKLVLMAQEQGLDVARRPSASPWSVLYTSLDDQEEALAEAAE